MHAVAGRLHGYRRHGGRDRGRGAAGTRGRGAPARRGRLPGRRGHGLARRGARGGEVAICASEALSADAGHLRYRETGRWQVEHPAADEPAARAFRSGTLMYSGGGGAFVRFDRQGETYTVYTGIGRGWEKAGVQVRAGERVVRAIACEGEVESELGPALFARAGLPDDPEGFEIP